MTEPAPFQTARSPHLSLLQAAVAGYMRRRGAAPEAATAAASALLTTGAPAQAGMDGRSRDAAPYPAPAALPTAWRACVAQAADALLAWLKGDGAGRQAALDRLRDGPCDPLWAETLAAYLADLGPDGVVQAVPYRHARAPDDFVVTAPAARLRIGLISDWATGTRAAATTLAQLAALKPDLLIHLGDIYYAATPDECRMNFLDPVRAALPDIPVFTLSGNHDMYGGGAGYYRLIDQLGQPASSFCLLSPDRSWQILAMDTGLHDRDPFAEGRSATFLEPSEVDWLCGRMRGFAGRTILLSHHQPFSALDAIAGADGPAPENPALMAVFARLAALGTVAGWFWGHEHTLSLYAPYRGVTRGRCIGYGAIPVASGSLTPHGLPAGPVLRQDVALPVQDGFEARGFALLELGRQEIAVSYFASGNATPLYRERLDDVAVA